MVRIAVNLLWCRPGQVGGSEDYLARQLRGIDDRASGFDITLFVLAGFGAAHPELAGFEQVVAPFSGANRLRRVIAEHRWLRAQTSGFDLVHHGGGTMPGHGSHASLLTVHDLQHLSFPHYVGAIKRRYLDWALPRSIGAATTIAVPTEFVRRTVIEAYGPSPDEVVVVPHGIEADLGEGATPEVALRSRYDLGEGPILVLPAMTHPHKGHGFAIQVLAEELSDPTLRLVLIGGVGAAEAATLADIERRGEGRRVRRLGRVSAADRSGLLAMAEAMVFPSEYEGFGAPVIEAMALGTPVICSDAACLPEVAGDAAIVLDREPRLWGQAIATLGSRRQQLIAAGYRRAEEFSIARSAQALETAYRQALAATAKSKAKR